MPDEVVKDSERLARFKREAQLLASLNYTNIAAIHGFKEAAADFPLTFLRPIVPNGCQRYFD